MIPVLKEHYKIQFLLPLIILFLSIYSIINGGFELSLSLVNSLLGIVAFVFFIFKKHISITLFYIWGIAQLIVLTEVNGGLGFNMSQVYYFGIGANITEKYSLTVNLLAIIYLILIRIIEMTYEKKWLLKENDTTPPQSKE